MVRHETPSCYLTDEFLLMCILYHIIVGMSRKLVMRFYAVFALLTWFSNISQRFEQMDDAKNSLKWLWNNVLLVS